jgi:phage terminase large subunit
MFIKLSTGKSLLFQGIVDPTLIDSYKVLIK